MKNSTIVKVFALLVGLGILFGVVLPWLISAADTLLVCVGIAIILGLLLWAVLWLNGLYVAHKKEQETQNQNGQEKKV